MTLFDSSAGWIQTPGVDFKRLAYRSVTAVALNITFPMTLD
jgi:hypothetical protein